MLLTAVVWQPGHHDASSDPVLQGQRSGCRGRLQVLRVGLRQLREAAVGEGGVLPDGQRVHGGGVHPGDGGQARVRQVEDARLGDDPGLQRGRDPRRWGVCPAAGHRAARRTVAAQSGGHVPAPTGALIGEQGVDPEVPGLLHVRSSCVRCVRRGAVRTCASARGQRTVQQTVTRS